MRREKPRKAGASFYIMIFIKKITKIGYIFVAIIIFLLIFTEFVFATPITAEFLNQSTVIINQIRGGECCDIGSATFFQKQISMLDKHALIGNFTLRYDALDDNLFTDIAKENLKHEYGALLEVVPSLAKDADVFYKGDDNSWYEAQHIFLIGYEENERYKLIDVYMEKFYEVFGKYPQFSGAWMIDPLSLHYIKDKYGVVAHQITREQFGTDSYTLYGGPVHYPYYPSKNWALIPSLQTSKEMPLIIRQTISDPVHTYGDQSDSFTSQPNDYFLRNDTTTYFGHLFLQAHSQLNPYTFSLVSLENSMTEAEHNEYEKQIKIIAKWRDDDKKHQVLSVLNYESIFRNNNLVNFLTVYSGVSQQFPKEWAWWINTNAYRVRVRLSNGELFISDLRIFDESFSDPYLNNPAKNYGWWIVPFALDGSRYSEHETNEFFLRDDRLGINSDNPEELIRVQLIANVNDLKVSREEDTILFFDDDVLLASFSENSFSLSDPLFLPKETWPKYFLNNLKFIEDEKELWGFSKLVDSATYTPFVAPSLNFDKIRISHRPLLFPEITFGILDKNKTYLYENNLFAIAGRNPSRLIFFPKNINGENILLSSFPAVISAADIGISLYKPHNSNGMIFIDVDSDKAQKIKLTVSHSDFNKEINIYFAPNCKEDIFYCLVHPRKSLWYGKTIIEDKIREFRQQESDKKKFQDGFL